MTKLRSKPSYAHINEGGCTKSKLIDANDDKTFEIYEKLVSYLARMSTCSAPAANWKLNRRSLFKKDGYHYPVMWMPKLKTGWQRLTYGEFCAFYEIEPFTGRA